MAPKKDKKPEAFDENAWRTVIEEAPLDEEHWKVKVVLFESAGTEQDRLYLNKFEVFAAEEKRFVIKNICKTETIFMINQLGGEKKVKDDTLRVFEEAQSYLKEKKDIPPDVLALVIKHLILKMKDEYLYISRQRLEVRQGMQRESATMIDKGEVKGSVSAQKPPEIEVSPPPPVKGKGKGDAEQVSPGSENTEGKKFNTLLRVRGEEWRDKVYVDDYPTDGPNLYVAVTGFVEPYLPGCLVRVGIPLTAVVQVRIDPNTTPIPSSLLKQTKRGQSLTELLAEKSLKFWDDLQFLRINRDSADDFKNTAFIVFAPPYWNSENLSGNPDKIYDEICFLMYDIQDLSRQHLHYQYNMSIIEIPEEECNERNVKHYDQQIHDLPLECVTIYSVLDTMLQTVCNPQESYEETSRSSLSTAVTMNEPQRTITEENKVENAEDLVRKVFNTLCNTDANKKTYRVTHGEEYEDQKDPIVINYGDIAKYNTFHLGNINLDNIIFSALLGMPIHNLWLNQSRPTGELEAKVNFHVNVLLSCFEREDVETAELNRLIHILACRKLYNNRSALKKRHLPTSTISEFKKNYLKRSALAEPLPKCPSLTSGHALSPSFPSMTRSDNEYEYAYSSSDPDPEVQRLKFLFECPDISELVTAVEIQNNEPLKRSAIDDFDIFEDFSGTCAFQILREAFNKFNCVDYKYCEVTDCFILMFYNSHNKDGIAREEWRCHLTTPLCLQDFFDFILEEHYDWIQNEEKIYDENLLTEARSISKDFIDPHALQSCLETTDVEMDLLMEGSLKHKEIVGVEESAHEIIDEEMPKRSVSPLSFDSSKISKKSKAASLKKVSRLSSHEHGECQASVELPAKPFLGYDLGDRRVEVFGKDATFFSKDGTRVVTMYTLTIPMNLEYIVLSVLPGNSHNEFWMHRALGDVVKTEIKDACESFRVTTKGQVMINIKKQMYQVRVATSSTDNVATSDKKAAPKVVTEQVTPVAPTYETKYFHSLYVTWPNGMITETVHEDNSPIISHIKQYHTRPMPYLDEEMRCISLVGEVIIFKPNGDIEVLKPDGTFIKILKYYKTVIVPVVTEPEPKEEPPVEKVKKSKGKLSKATSKSSKMGVLDEDHISEEKPPEYELVVDEFEIIEADGLRQRWIQNVPIDIEKLLIRTATDHCIGEVFSRRMDGTNTLINKDGLNIVTFPDGTRIITTYVIDDEEVYPEWSDVEIEYFELFQDPMEGRSKGSVYQKSDTGDYYGSTSGTSISKKVEEEEIKETERTDGYLLIHMMYSIEHLHFSTISINTVTEKISVESPNQSVVSIDKHNNYDIILDAETSASFNGENLNISYEACSECRSFTNCDVKIMTKDDTTTSDTKVEPVWLKMTDSFSIQMNVDEEGGISLPETPPVSEANHPDNTTNSKPNESVTNNYEEKEYDVKSETSVVSHAKCREMYLAKNVRFFVLKRELTCAELLHRTLIEQYKRECRWKPWCSINHYDTFGDHRSLVTILTPIHLTETEKWLMESKQANTPKFLTYKDLKKDTGKGFYYWMRPYDRFVSQPTKSENVLPERLPRAYILRTLEQEWDDSQEHLRGGRELLRAVLRYRCIMEADSETILNIPIIDSRTEDERRIDDIIQALAHKVYEDLKVRVADDVQKRVKAEITSRPAKPPEDLSVEGEFDEDTIDETKNIEEERESVLNEIEQGGAGMSPALRKYWRRRQEELKEEEFYKYLLREGSVPPYFRNVLGGAIWWDINNATSEAVTIAERRVMKCVCADNDTTSVGGSITEGPFT